MDNPGQANVLRSSGSGNGGVCFGLCVDRGGVRADSPRTAVAPDTAAAPLAIEVLKRARGELIQWYLPERRLDRPLVAAFAGDRVEPAYNAPAGSPTLPPADPGRCPVR